LIMTITCESGPSGAATTNEEHIVNTNPNPATTTQPALALRRHSIRTLTPSELRVAHGGQGGGTQSTASQTGHTQV
jgi:hypothetical protein